MIAEPCYNIFLSPSPAWNARYSNLTAYILADDHQLERNWIIIRIIPSQSKECLHAVQLRYQL